jgi:hypothetical protein
MDQDTRRQLDRFRTECGCRAGGLGLLLSVSGYLLWAWMDPTIRGTGSVLLSASAVGLAGAVAGKILGILWGRYRYWVLARRIAAPERTVSTENSSPVL